MMTKAIQEMLSVGTMEEVLSSHSAASQVIIFTIFMIFMILRQNFGFHHVATDEMQLSEMSAGNGE